MTPSIDTILIIADCYREMAGIPAEKTLSYRIFGDSKKLEMMRSGGDLTVTRYNMAMSWFAHCWPDGQPMPAELRAYLQPEFEAGDISSRPCFADGGRHGLDAPVSNLQPNE